MTLRLIPRSLLARTILIILLALVASQLVSITLFRYYAREPRAQFGAMAFISQLKTIRTALDSLPPEQHAEFLHRLREERGIRVIRARDEPLALAPDLPALQVARERLREQIDPQAEIYVRPRVDAKSPVALVIKMRVAGTDYWAVFPRGRVVEQDYTNAWLGWGAVGGLLALAAAVFLVRRVNRPLKALAEAARDVGQGKTPPPLVEMGPEEVKQVAAAFNQMRDDLQRRDQQRATFLAGVSHDLRTPLSRLRLGIEMLPADAATRADLEKDIEDIDGVISQFMAFARNEGEEPLEWVNLNTLVQSVVERAIHAGANITLSGGSLPSIRLRPLAIRRLINNLVDNAHKHAGGEITVVTEVSANEVVLSVHDRGSGIPPDQVDRLKQPFTRLDASRAGASGAGLGLTIVERIAKLHGGSFALTERDGGGTSATVRFPLSEGRGL